MAKKRKSADTKRAERRKFEKEVTGRNKSKAHHQVDWHDYGVDTVDHDEHGVGTTHRTRTTASNTPLCDLGNEIEVMMAEAEIAEEELDKEEIRYLSLEEVFKQQSTTMKQQALGCIDRALFHRFSVVKTCKNLA